MPTPPLSDDLALEAFDAWEAAGRNATKAAGTLGMPVGTFKHRLKAGKKLRQIGEDGVAKIRATGAPVENAKAAWFKDGEVSVLCRFDDAEAEGQTFLERCRVAFDGIKPAKLRKPPKRTDADLMTVYPIVDHHLAMQAWADETGEDYNLENGCARLLDSATELMASTPRSAEAQIVNLGDFFHIDDSTNETPASHHRLDADGRFFTAVDAGVELTAAVIDMALQKHDRVTYRAIRGNHDENAHVALTVAILQRYRNEPRVTVVKSKSDFHAIRWGVNFALCNHGDKVKPDALVMLMADHYAKDWGETFWRFAWTGHVHHANVKDFTGAQWESFRTLAPKDAYAHTHGYSSRQTMQAITLHKQHGEVMRNKVNVTPPWALQCVS